MSTNRRAFLRGAAAAAGLLGSRRLVSQPPPADPHAGHTAHAATDQSAELESTPDWRPEGRLDYLPVEAPDVGRLPWEWIDGAKQFHLICEPVTRRFLPWHEPFNVWGYNGSVPGPTIEVVEGDRVRIVVENRLPEATSMHWHGLEIPAEMDGVPGMNQEPIPPGGTFHYEFTLHQNGTFFYHSHMPMQEMLGMIGLFVIHPRRPYEPRVDRDFGLIFQGWAILPNNPTPNTLAMEFNWLTINGVSGPATTPLLVKQGERVRLRMVNLGMDHHPIHMHGHQWNVVGTEGGRIPQSAWVPGNTVLLGVAQARDLELEAEHLGDWMLHCHLPHHMMNHMASMVGPLSEPPPGLATGGSMERGMGMLHGGHALSEENGAAMGRSLGAGNQETEVSTMARMHTAAAQTQEARPGHAAHGGHGIAVAPNARQVPGYPQDMVMVMDEAFAEKPETWGLRKGWTAGMMGMMTMIRVLPPAMYDRIQELKREQERNPSFRLPPAPEWPAWKNGSYGSESSRGGGR